MKPVIACAFPKPVAKLAVNWTLRIKPLRPVNQTLGHARHVNGQGALISCSPNSLTLPKCLLSLKRAVKSKAAEKR